jgi:hypothetical protein
MNTKQTNMKYASYNEMEALKVAAKNLIAICETRNDGTACSLHWFSTGEGDYKAILTMCGFEDVRLAIRVANTWEKNDFRNGFKVPVDWVSDSRIMEFVNAVDGPVCYTGLHRQII